MPHSVAMIDLNNPHATVWTSRRAAWKRALTAPAPAALVAAAIALIPAIIIATRPTAVVVPVAAPSAPVEHLVQPGVSAFPATATAGWVDAAGVSHDLDPWSDSGPVRVPARSVFVAVVAGDAPVQCTLVVDGRTVDEQTARNGVRVCVWSASGS